jgi:hypothetical protein
MSLAIRTKFSEPLMGYPLEKTSLYRPILPG